MSNEIEAEGSNEASELDNAALESTTGGSEKTMLRLDALKLQRDATQLRVDRTLRITDLLGKNLLLDKLSISNTDWQ